MSQHQEGYYQFTSETDINFVDIYEFRCKISFQAFSKSNTQNTIILHSIQNVILIIL